MIETLKKIFGIGPGTDYKALQTQGAIIVDVRSKGEYASGHIKGSINIPVNELAANLAKLNNKNKAIITCCASGMRSASARGILQSKGYTEVYNGGGWSSLQRKLS